MVPIDTTVSVVLPTYNRADYLPQAIDSLLAQQRPPEEIIVVDDGSTDQTAQVLARYVGRIRTMTNEQNSGKSASLNRAIAVARGSHIWIFDDDDVALPEALKAHTDYLLAQPDIDFTYSDKFMYRGAGDIWQREAWHIDRLPDYPPQEFLVRTMEGMHTLMQGMLVPARCYRKVGRFDESLQRCEDHDMLLRLARHYRAGNIGQPTFVYRDHDGVRGPASGLHAGVDRFAVLFRYRQEIFRQVWKDYPLRDYLPGYQEAGEPTGVLLAQALLQRSCIMFTQGLLDEGFADLKVALQHLPSPPPAEGRLPLLLSRSIDIETWRYHDRWRLLRCLNHGLRDQAHLARYVARGLYWNIDRALKKREWMQVLQSLQMLAAYGLWQGAIRVLPRSTRTARH